MPTYEYHCDTCAKNFDVVQSFHDEPLSVCPTCGSPVRKVFGNVGIVFKGSGFYKTDSRTSGSAKKPEGGDTPPGDAGSKGADSGTEGKPSSTAAESAPSTSPASSPSSSGTTSKSEAKPATKAPDKSNAPAS